MTASGPVTYGSLRMLADEKFVVLQPASGPEERVETLSVDLVSGSTSLSKRAAITGSHIEVLGVVGAFQLQQGAAVVVITGAEQVATVSGITVYKVTETRVLTAPVKNHDDTSLLKLLQDAVDPRGSGRNLYFAYGADLTLTAQRAAAVYEDPVLSIKPIWQRADNRFFWNRKLAKPLIEAEAHKFVLTMILGFVQEISNITLDGLQQKASAHLVQIARRAVPRAGTRHWRRGADPEGNAANFVESEQIISLDNDRVVASFVQVRGSIPLLWTQIPNIKYKPPTRIAPKERSSPAFQRHFEKMAQDYKAVVAINLVNHHGSEGKLAEAFRQEAELFGSTHPNVLQYIPFDFHKECGASKYERLSTLWEKIDPFFRSHACFYKENGEVKTKQVGVCRTNCIDCLDRTNVVQSVLGRKALESALRSAGVLGTSGSIATAFPQLEVKFKCLWADHGDAISTQYAGTGALKAGFTRTGKRTIAGFIDDGVKSMVRYYLNNFQDGKKQDAVDLVTGAYEVRRGARPPFKPTASPTLPLLMAVLAFCYAMNQLVQIGQVEGGFKAAAGHLVQSVLLPLTLAVGLVAMVVKNGRRLVCKPQLCMQLANTVDAGSGLGG